MRFAAPRAAAAAARGLREAGDSHKGARARRPTGRGGQRRGAPAPGIRARLALPPRPASWPTHPARPGGAAGQWPRRPRPPHRSRSPSCLPAFPRRRGGGRRRKDAARCVWSRPRLEPSGAAGSGSVGGQPRSACAASDWGSAQ